MGTLLARRVPNDKQCVERYCCSSLEGEGAAVANNRSRVKKGRSPRTPVAVYRSYPEPLELGTTKSK